MRTRVYIEDTDAGGVVFYANYLRYMERARTEALRQAGVDLVEWQARHRRLFVVRSLQIQYRVPARLDDQLTVHADMIRVKRASLLCDQPILRGGDRLLEARVELACIDADRLSPTRIPAPILDALGSTTADVASMGEPPA